MYSGKDMNSFAGSASTSSPPNPRSEINLESLHDEIHGAVGGTGAIEGTAAGTFYWQMSSAFDPIFWMHHAMVDRMLVMHQVLHPDSWVLPQQQVNPTWTLPEGALISADTRRYH
jgi:tyrosinase